MCRRRGEMGMARIQPPQPLFSISQREKEAGLIQCSNYRCGAIFHPETRWCRVSYEWGSTTDHARWEGDIPQGQCPICSTPIKPPAPPRGGCSPSRNNRDRGGIGMRIIRTLFYLRCYLGLCPCKPQSDDKGCWGQCLICGKKCGYVTREAIRKYIEECHDH